MDKDYYGYPELSRQDQYIPWHFVWHRLSEVQELQHIRKVFYTPKLLLYYAKRNWEEGIDYFHNGNRWLYNTATLYKFELDKVKQRDTR